MTGQQLKNSILQMAVQGKLVPQDPNDEPASVLLERIRQEKDALIKEGKIKKEKNPSIIFRGTDNLPYEKIGNFEPVCIADEVPFEIPDSWEWVRLKDIAVINPRNTELDNLDAGFIPMPLLMAGYRNEHTFETRKWHEIKNGFTHFRNNDIVVAKITPCFQNRKSAIIQKLPNGIGAGTTELHVVRKINDEINNEYLLMIFKSAYFIDNGIKVFSGTAGQQRIGKDYIENLFIPLPPYNEQKRIVNKLQEVFPLTKQYAITHQRISEIQKSFPEQLKKSILQQAVQGKLVPQDPDDEPASVLLERIRQEKDALIKAGKIKKDKHENVIFRRDNSHYEKLDGTERCIDDEIPFEIPDNWTWIRLGTISTYGESKTKIKAQDADKTLWELDLEDIEKGGKILNYKTVIECGATGDKTVFEKGDILYSRLRPYLLKILVAEKNGICTPEIVPFKVYGNIISKYIVLVLKSPFVDNYINSITYGVKMPRVGTDTMINLLIPLPPLKEQDRIVRQIDELLPIISNLRQ